MTKREHYQDSPTPGISLVIPAYNEAEVIALAIDEATQALSKVASDYEIIVVDDGSNDRTASIVASVASGDPKVHLLRHESNQGYGAALRNGFAEARKDLVAFTDADCQFDLNELDRFLLLAESYDAVCGYRIERRDTRLRCLYSFVYNWIVRLVLGIRVRDVDCALKVFRRHVLQRVEIRSDGFLVNSDLLTQIGELGGSIVEVGVSHRARPAGQSTVSVRHIPRVLASLARFWWNEVQFGGRDGTGVRDTDPDKSRRLGWMQFALIAMTCILLFSNLGYPLIDRDETRYAEIPREMLVTGDWILPTLNFKTYYDKPPLLYWLVASSFSLFGVHEWSARLVPAIAALGTLLLVIWFSNRHLGRRIGLISGGVLMLTGGFAFSCRYLLLDGVLTFFVTASLIAAYEAFHAREDRVCHWGWWITACIACGLGCLTKGPLSVVLFLPVVFAFTWLERHTARLRIAQVATLIAIVCGITLPWMIAVSIRDETFLYEFLVNHNIRRFAGQYHDRPIWYFIPVLLAAGFPWSFLAIPFVRHLVTRRRSVRKSRGVITGFLCLWVVWMFAFFSASRCKLPTYMLPTAPAFAMLLGMYLDRLTQRVETLDAWERFARVWSARLATATGCVTVVAFFVYYMGQSTNGFAFVSLDSVMPLGATLVGTSLLYFSSRHRHIDWAATASVSILLLIFSLHQLVPAYSYTRTVFAGARRSVHEIGLEPSTPVATIGHEFSEVPFYLKREDILNLRSSQDPSLVEFANDHDVAVLVVRSDILVGEVYSQLPPGMRVQSLEHRGPAHLLRLSRSSDYVATSNVHRKR
ncbi:MAG: glycosyltransferase [Planctomycetota bacterium]